MGVCNCSMFCCTLLYVHSSIAIILMGKRELIALLNLSSWCLVMVERLFLAVPRGCLQFVIVVFPDHTHLLFIIIFMCIYSFYSFCWNNIRWLCCQIMYISIVIIYESVIICMYIWQETVQFTSIKYMLCSVLCHRNVIGYQIEIHHHYGLSSWKC